MSDLIISITLFAIPLCVSPGPNNVMLTASGANFGFRRTLPHILGIALGVGILFVLNSLGLSVVFKLYPAVQRVFKFASAAYLIYFAIKMASAKRSDNKVTNRSPLNIFQAASFQLINPKVWVITITALSTFAQSGENYFYSCVLIVSIFVIICLPANLLWAVLGNFISRYLKNARVFRIFNFLMAGLIIASICQIVF